MNIQAPSPSAYAPAKADPIRLASATIQAVDRIGAATYEEIEKTADEIMRQEAAVQLQQAPVQTALAHRGCFQQVEGLQAHRNTLR
jgi:hypothetical protein